MPIGTGNDRHVIDSNALPLPVLYRPVTNRPSNKNETILKKEDIYIKMSLYCFTRFPFVIVIAESYPSLVAQYQRRCPCLIQCRYSAIPIRYEDLLSEKFRIPSLGRVMSHSLDKTPGCNVKLQQHSVPSRDALCFRRR